MKGKTTQEIKSQLLEKYKEVIINPNIEVTIYKYRPLNIYIGGEVNRPGLYKLEYQNNFDVQDTRVNPDKIRETLSFAAQLHHSKVAVPHPS